MKYIKDFNNFHAEKLAYVIFSRFDELFIQEQSNPQSTFDYMIDITKKGQQTGRFFAVDVQGTEKEDISDTLRKIDLGKYENIKLPLILLIVNTIKDKSFFSWLIKPTENGKLTKISDTQIQMNELDNDKMKHLISDVTTWYDNK